MNRKICFEHEIIIGRQENVREYEKYIEKINRIYEFKAFRRDFNGIYSTSYVGTIKAKDLHIDILPKIYKKNRDETQAIKNFLLMLSFCENLNIKTLDLKSLRVNNGFFESLASIFSKKLLETLKMNYYREYSLVEEELKYLKGRLILKKQIRKVDISKLCCGYFKYTDNIELHKKLKLVSYFLTFIVKSSEIQRLLKDILSIYNNVDLDFSIVNRQSIVNINKLNFSYTPLLNFADLFLQSKTFQLVSENGNGTFFSFLFDMNIIFESFISKIIRSEWNLIRERVEKLRNCNIKLQAKRKYLIEGPSKKLFGLRPDIVIFEKKGKTNYKAIIDIKYKILNLNREDLGMDQNDVYQMYAYLGKYNSPIGILIYPFTESQVAGSNSENFRCNENYKVFNLNKNRKLYVFLIDLRRDLNNKSEFKELKKSLIEIFSEVFS